MRLGDSLWQPPKYLAENNRSYLFRGRALSRPMETSDLVRASRPVFRPSFRTFPYR